jgi:predicted dehydrogenase
MRKLRIGIVGMGRMGITHYSIINTHPQVKVVAVSDSSKLILEILSKYIPELMTFGDYREMFDKADLDGVIVCTPSSLHYQVCEYACQKNINVFCEKPFTTSPEEAMKLTKMFDKKGLINQVGFDLRFHDVFTTVKEYLEDEIIGKVIRFKSEMYSSTISKPKSGDGWRSKRENGGGVTYEMASHALDLVNFLIGCPIKVVGSITNQVYSENVEDIVSSTLLLNNRISGTLYVNWCDTSYRKPATMFEIFGTDGKIVADQYGIKVFLNTEDTKYNFRKGWNNIQITDIFKPVPYYVRGNEFTNQLYYFAESILDRSLESKCTFNDGYNVQNIIQMIFEDSLINNEIK